MNNSPWWERYPERLAYELAALRQAGIAHQRDEDAFARAVMRLHLEVPHAGERLPLVVTFPDLYPFFRFQVCAPTLKLSHHQNPFGKNLCLIGRATHEWRTTDTVAHLLQRQLPALLESGSSADHAMVSEKEQRQAEPFSDYYPYPESTVIIPGRWSVPAGASEGRFTIVPVGWQGPPPEHFVRGIMVELKSRSGATLLRADSAIKAAFPGNALSGCWIRVDQPIHEANQQLFLKHLLSRSVFARTAPVNRVDGGCLRMWGVLFPEEVAWRTRGEGWIFVCSFEEKPSTGIRRDAPTHKLKGPKRPKDRKVRKKWGRKS